MKLHSVMNHDFSMVPRAKIQRSTFNRSHGHKTTFDTDYLIPVFVDEVLPGDTFNCKMTAFARLSTLKFPIMDNLYLDSFFFAVPNRLLWENWKKFNGERHNPDDSVDYILPTVEMPEGGADVGSLSDYFGIPVKVKKLKTHSLFHRAYNLIWNEWFRDQNLQESVEVPRGDGPDTYTDFKLLKRGKRHDYFTSCLPWPQKGDSVPLPLEGDAPVKGFQLSGNPTKQRVQVTDKTGTHWEDQYPNARIPRDSKYSLNFNFDSEGKTNIYADLSEVTAATINQLRQAFQVQKLYERDARGGTRYTEIVKSHFGVMSPDSRLQRPEYLGGNSTPININPVVQTSSSKNNHPQGSLAAFGTTTAVNHGFIKSFTEHCVIIGLVSVRADLTYQQGLNKMFSRSTRFDFYWPALSHIGEQTVLNREIYADGTDKDEEVFGYQERYAEYRYKPSVITGKFRSKDSAKLDAWHLSQEFGNLPKLGPKFIEENVPMDRVLAVRGEPDFIFDSYFNLKCTRPMPAYSVPGLIDHF